MSTLDLLTAFIFWYTFFYIRCEEGRDRGRKEGRKKGWGEGRKEGGGREGKTFTHMHVPFRTWTAQ